jgi:hypothetical protein
MWRIWRRKTCEEFEEGKEEGNVEHFKKKKKKKT